MTGSVSPLTGNQTLPVSQKKQTVNLLAVTKTRHAMLQTLPYYDPRYSHHFPYFSYGMVDLMLRDSRVNYGLGLIKGPLYSLTKFFTEEEGDDPAINQAIIDLEYHYSYVVKSDSEETAEFTIDALNRFWANGLYNALQGIEWGYSPNQVVYKRRKDGNIEYDKLIHYGIHHVKPVSRGHDLTGIYLKKQKKFIPIPKSFIYVHNREFNSFTGKSQLIGCHIPWHETWMVGGARDVRRNWYFRNSYDGGTLYVPQETIIDPVTGEKRSAEEVGAAILENSYTGSWRIFPKPLSSQGKNDKPWEYEPPKSNTTPQGMPEYLQDMRIEILEGMGIPPEVVENPSSVGLGSATGRKVPLQAFYASLSPIAVNVIEDCLKQIIVPLLRVNGMDDEVKVSRILPKNYDPVQSSQDSIEATDNATDTTKPNPNRS